MARSDFNPEVNRKMGNNHEQNKMVDWVAREVGVPRDALSDYIHQIKGYDYSGDFSYAKLVQLAKELKQELKR